jgi:hypothetical protein
MTLNGGMHSAGKIDHENQKKIKAMAIAKLLQ